MERTRIHERRWFRAGMLLVLGYAVFYMSGAEVSGPSQRYYSYSLSEGGGVGWDPLSVWKQMSLADVVIPPAYRSPNRYSRGIQAQRATGLAAVATFFPTLPAPDVPEETPLFPGREVIRNLSMHLLVQDPAISADNIGGVAVRLGGYVLRSQI